MGKITVGEVIKNAVGKVTFSFYRQGYLYYTVRTRILKGEIIHYTDYIFPVEVADLQTATVSREEKPITMMRYIRKAIEDGTFVRGA